MPRFTVNASRVDPYKDFRFQVVIDGQTVAGLSKVSALTRTTSVIEFREGGDPASPRKMPGQTTFAPITLERGVTHDTAFLRWANKVWNFGAGPGAESSLADFRKDITLNLYDEAGQLALAYNIYRAWVSEFRALPDLDSSSSGTAIQSITLENEGFEMDEGVVEPRAPSFEVPAS